MFSILYVCIFSCFLCKNNVEFLRSCFVVWSHLLYYSFSFRVYYLFNKSFECIIPIFMCPCYFLESTSLIKKCPKSNNKRDRIEIMAKILIETEKGVNKTRIMYNCNLNYQKLQLYLKFLLITKLLARKVDNDGREKFVTTTEGKNFVEDFYVLQTLMTQK